MILMALTYIALRAYGEQILPLKDPIGIDLAGDIMIDQKKRLRSERALTKCALSVRQGFERNPKRLLGTSGCPICAGVFVADPLPTFGPSAAVPNQRGGRGWPPAGSDHLRELGLSPPDHRLFGALSIARLQRVQEAA